MSIKPLLILLTCAAPAMIQAAPATHIEDFSTYRTRAQRQEQFLDKYNRLTSNASQAACQRSALNASFNLYLEGKFPESYRNFSNAYTFAPDPIVFVFLADTSLRIFAADAAKSYLFKKPGNACWRSQSFVAKARKILTEEYEMGLDLRAAIKNYPSGSEKTFERARQTSACLDAMITEYENSADETCIDIQYLKRCLGQPLIEGPKRSVPPC